MRNTIKHPHFFLYRNMYKVLNKRHLAFTHKSHWIFLFFLSLHCMWHTLLAWWLILIVDYIWNHLKTKQLRTPMKDLLDWIIYSKKVHPKSGPHILVAAYIKDMEEIFFFFLPVCPHTFWSDHLSCVWGIPALSLKPTSWRFQSRLKVFWDI